MEVDWVEGETEPRDFKLTVKNDSTGLYEPFNGTGLTPGLGLWKRSGTAVDTTGDVAWVVAADGHLRYSPDIGDLVATEGELRARFSMTDGAGKVGYFPRKEPMIWRVRKP